MAYRPLSVVFLCCLLSVGCSEKDNRDSAPQPAIISVEAIDAAPAGKPLSPAPAMGTHLDGVSDYRPRNSDPSRGIQDRSGNSIELTLRSTPPGATASIDGQVVGITPTFWSGKAGHKNHEYTFVKPGYSMARYRFVATQNGVVHATLSLLKQSEDASSEAPPIVP